VVDDKNSAGQRPLGQWWAVIVWLSLFRHCLISIPSDCQTLSPAAIPRQKFRKHCVTVGPKPSLEIPGVE
jgi:hypothetical protein